MRPLGTNETFEARFWSKVDKRGPDDCWPWLGSCGSSHGYGQLSKGARSGPITAHRASWELHNGPIPDGLFALHKCDCRPCVNPAHIFLGTAADNTADMMMKGRHRSNPRSGERHGRAKLTERQARDIKYSSESARVVAIKYGVCLSTAYYIRKGSLWQHI